MTPDFGGRDRGLLRSSLGGGNLPVKLGSHLLVLGKFLFRFSHDLLRCVFDQVYCLGKFDFHFGSSTSDLVEHVAQNLLVLDTPQVCMDLADGVLEVCQLGHHTLELSGSAILRPCLDAVRSRRLK